MWREKSRWMKLTIPARVKGHWWSNLRGTRSKERRSTSVLPCSCPVSSSALIAEPNSSPLPREQWSWLNHGLASWSRVQRSGFVAERNLLNKWNKSFTCFNVRSPGMPKSLCKCGCSASGLTGCIAAELGTAVLWYWMLLRITLWN